MRSKSIINLLLVLALDLILMFVMMGKKTLPLSQAIPSGVKETSREEHIEKQS